MPETKLERLDVIDMHIKPWRFGPPTNSCPVLFPPLEDVALVVENKWREGPFLSPLLLFNLKH